jgi:hypothetical protein
VERTKAIEHYDRLVATNPKVDRKGDTMPYTSVNGNMFSVMTREGALALRLPEPARSAFLKYKTTLSVQYGHVMAEYVTVPDALLAKTKELKPHFDASYAYAATLKPKATTKKKVAKRT